MTYLIKALFQVDIVILKDITEMKELIEFRKRNEKLKSMPILIWPSNYGIDDLNELIKVDKILNFPTLKEHNNLFYGTLFLSEVCWNYFREGFLGQ